MKTIIYDTREHFDVIQSILDEFYENGIRLKKCKLDVGDYANPDFNDIVIDRKQHLSEVAINLGVDFQRFKKEIIRSRQQKKLLVVLIADPTRTCLEDVKSWKPLYNTHNKKHAMTGEKLYKIMRTQSECYKDCLRYEFVKPEDMAKRIMELLKATD